MSAALALAPLGEADVGEARTLNDTAAPHVPNATDAEFRRLLGFASLALTARHGGELLGLLVAVPPGTAYDSPNYGWFCARGGRFLYIDRIVVSAAARGLGVGRRLYEAAAEAAGAAPLVCEVNEVPPNPGSLAFHKALGFQPVGQLAHGPEKRVVLLSRPAGAL